MNIQVKKPYNKFGVGSKEARTLNGTTYHSVKEKHYRQKLNVLTKSVDISRRVIKIEEQLKFDIQIGDRKITGYVLDFRVTYGDGTIEHIDVKGYKKGTAYEIFRIKKNLMYAIHGITVIEA